MRELQLEELSQVAEIADKLSPIIVKKPERATSSSTVNPWEIKIATILAKVTNSHPFKLLKQFI